MKPSDVFNLGLMNARYKDNLLKNKIFNKGKYSDDRKYINLISKFDLVKFNNIIAFREDDVDDISTIYNQNIVFGIQKYIEDISDLSYNSKLEDIWYED